MPLSHKESPLPEIDPVSNKEKDLNGYVSKEGLYLAYQNPVTGEFFPRFKRGRLSAWIADLNESDRSSAERWLTENEFKNRFFHGKDHPQELSKTNHQKSDKRNEQEPIAGVSEKKADVPESFQPAPNEKDSPDSDKTTLSLSNPPKKENKLDDLVEMLEGMSEALVFNVFFKYSTNKANSTMKEMAIHRSDLSEKERADMKDRLHRLTLISKVAIDLV